jgi:hypothetical protein
MIFSCSAMRAAGLLRALSAQHRHILGIVGRQGVDKPVRHQADLHHETCATLAPTLIEPATLKSIKRLSL